VTLANNHAEDCGLQGLKDTVDFVRQAGLLLAGVSLEGDPFEALRWKVPGGHMALLAVTTKRNRGYPPAGAKLPVAFKRYRDMKKHLTERVRAHRERHPLDLLVVSLHWGAEGDHRPDTAQRKIARAVIASGADAVWGHHPHVLQPVELVGDGVILYSTGNLVFDMQGAHFRRSALFRLRFIRQASGRFAVKEMEVHPLQIAGPEHRPRPVAVSSASEGSRILRSLFNGKSGIPLKWADHRFVWRAGGGTGESSRERTEPFGE
jgi:poly-gamma-glutamate synthesis protein (capsule biosynthesis protein)